LKRFQKQNAGSSEEEKTEILSHAYDGVMERIYQQRPGLKQLAVKVLSWITCAERPLSVPELQYAVAIKEGQYHLDEGDLPHIGDIVSVCLGLITIDDESSIIRLVHYTTQEYFVQTQKDWVPNAHAEIAKACITCLSFDIFEAGRCLTCDDLEARLQTITLYRYAAQTWGCHVRYSPIEENRLIWGFLQSTPKVLACGQVMYHGDIDLECETTSLHVAVLFGLETLTLRMLEQKADINSKDSYSETPLLNAVAYGHSAVVKLLLEWKADVDCQDQAGRTPLSYAARRGDIEMVKLLLEWKADINCQDQSGRTPLSDAAIKGDIEMVKLLLEWKADVNFQDQAGRTPLSYADRNEYSRSVESMKVLFEFKADVDCQDKAGRAPLLYAVENDGEDSAEVAEILPDYKADANCRDQAGRTPISYGIKGGNVKGVESMCASVNFVEDCFSTESEAQATDPDEQV
jgi:ankyrin repeat protein